MSRGFTLLEVLVAALLVAIPVVAAQMLMLHSAAVFHGAQGHAHARAAARHYVARVSAFHLGGLWPDSSVSPGYWLPSIEIQMSASELPVSPPQCINRWCSATEWADFESANLACVLNVQSLGEFCSQVVAIPHHVETDRNVRFTRFNVTVRADDGLDVVIEWPTPEGTWASASTSTSISNSTLASASSIEDSDMHRIESDL